MDAFKRYRPEVDILPGVPGSAVCVQRSLDSRNSAIHGAYRILLRPSSLLEPRHPSLKIVKGFKILKFKNMLDYLYFGLSHDTRQLLRVKRNNLQMPASQSDAP